MKKTFSNLSDLASAFGKEIDNPQSTVNNADQTLVYSTAEGRIKANSNSPVITPSDGYAKVRRETKGRKGKGVVTISGLGIDNSALKALAKQLKKTCGTGGSVVGEVIEIQGDKREVIKSVLEENGYKVKFIGG
ncbi:translation initiation factor 1 (eIF-1/SUI1) [Colwellia chukchiensis]|uniref:Translation initiation factor 1 (eIF-1/SUI1) n=1 Tax=Colwellia chukchiensis TaxID=641665 RepID=A0A1H7S713_9GAMM|nr:translation initiation factor 1 (eIF-1/SUI1) [Colwellia chukchiensis]